MICQMLFNNNIVHESLKSDSDEQYRLLRTSGYLGYCVEKTILKILIFLNKKYVHSSCVWKLMKRFTCRIINPTSLKYLFFNHFNFCINKTQFPKSRFFQHKTMIFPNTAVYMWTPHVWSDWSNWPIKSHVGIWYALTCKQHGRGFQNLQIRLKIAKKNCR